MRSLATWCLRRRRLVLVGWIVALFAIAGVAGSVGASYTSNFDLPSSDSQRANDLLKHTFRAEAGDQAQVVFHTASGRVTDPAVRARLQPVLAQVARVPHVIGVQTPYAAAGARAISGDGRTAYAVVRFDKRANDLPKADAQRVIDVAQGAARSGLEVEAGGQPIERAQRDAGGTQTGIGLLAAIVILLFTFGSVVAMGMPVITALFALGTGLSLVTLATHVFDVADWSPQLAGMIGLGVGIDYALFVVTRYRAGLRAGLDVHEAVATALLLVLCIPTLSLRLGSSDAGSDPATATTRKAYDLLAQGFGPGFNGPLQVVAQLPRAGDGATAARLRAAMASERGVAHVTPAQLSPNGSVAVLTAYPRTSPQSATTQALVSRLRATMVPQMWRATGVQVHIGGPTAVFDDLGRSLTDKLPLFIGVVVALSALLLMAVFRS